MGWLQSLQNACIFYRNKELPDIEDPEVKEVIRHAVFKSYESLAQPSGLNNSTSSSKPLRVGVPAGMEEGEAEEDSEETYEEVIPKMAEECEEDSICGEGSPLKKIAKTG